MSNRSHQENGPVPGGSKPPGSLWARDRHCGPSPLGWRLLGDEAPAESTERPPVAPCPTSVNQSCAHCHEDDKEVPDTPCHQHYDWRNNTYKIYYYSLSVTNI